MGDLVQRLYYRDTGKPAIYNGRDPLCIEAAERIKSLERENARIKEFNAGLAQESFELQRELAEERALCDRLYGVALFRENDPMPVIEAYRNKRGEG